MDKIIDVAAYIAKKYKEVSKEAIDEMKLHKLLYLTQREAYAITGNPAFDGEFEGWIYGPVCREVRSGFYAGDIHVPTDEISEETQYIANNVIYEYGQLASWKLSEISHADSSWKNSRKGLGADDNGNVPLKPEDIKADALKVRPYDYVWDMYYDEFPDEAVNS